MLARRDGRGQVGVGVDNLEEGQPRRRAPSMKGTLDKGHPRALAACMGGLPQAYILTDQNIPGDVSMYIYTLE
jgi:hypothetical protein